MVQSQRTHRSAREKKIAGAKGDRELFFPSTMEGHCLVNAAHTKPRKNELQARRIEITWSRLFGVDSREMSAVVRFSGSRRLCECAFGRGHETRWEHVERHARNLVSGGVGVRRNDVN